MTIIMLMMIKKQWYCYDNHLFKNDNDDDSIMKLLMMY